MYIVYLSQNFKDFYKSSRNSINLNNESLGKNVMVSERNVFIHIDLNK